MSDNNETKRLSRLTAILTQLQTKRLLIAPELANKYGVSIRTIYRDIRALEQSGVPIITEEGKGYSLMEGYRIPPVMFTENQANALILAEQLVIEKIKAVLKHNQKDKAKILADRTRFDLNVTRERSSNNLSDIQYALTNFIILKIDYTNEKEETTTRLLEPFALISTDNWLLIAYCRMRKAFRFFRLDRIKKLELLNKNFEPHKMTLQEYLNNYNVC